MSASQVTPPLPVPGDTGPAWRVRPFGQTIEDLAVEFDPWIQPRLVNEVLHRCLLADDTTAGADFDPVEWTVNRRLQGLLAVAIATVGRQIEVTLRCPAQVCGTEMMLDLDLLRFQATTDSREVVCQPEEGHRLRLRVPTGADQARWVEASSAVVIPEPALALGRNLVVEVDGAAPVDGWPLPEAWVAAIEAALEQADRLTNLELHARCPACGATFAAPFDLEAALLKRLSERTSVLFDEVHRLASAYHWSEAAILALPPHRRREYLRRIND